MKSLLNHDPSVSDNRSYDKSVNAFRAIDENIEWTKGHYTAHYLTWTTVCSPYGCWPVCTSHTTAIKKYDWQPGKWIPQPYTGAYCTYYESDVVVEWSKWVFSQAKMPVAINVWVNEPEVTSHMVVTHINQDDPSKNYVETTNYPEKYFKHSSHTYVFPENTVKYGIYHDDPIANWTDWQASMNMCRTETVGGKSCCVGSQPSYDDDLGYTVYVLVNDKPTDDGDPHDPSVPENPGNPDDPVDPASYGELTDASIQRTNSTRVQVDD